ncbi:hypothetical protein N3K66_008132 [Trichothecium roseum]|uniref:Uncharacterized protein n=1 Tax=Trichothecium roseum TaxID=47278 RepID=A0ACC0USK5_9HYPO|nr:hypothetical protein N3K66_008132 [Trichothecium roseum]
MELRQEQGIHYAHGEVIDARAYDNFHLFSRLPPEIRLKIWSFSLPASRFVPITCGSDPTLSLDHPTVYPLYSITGCTSSAKIPVAMHVCSESRHHAMSKAYNLYFGFAQRPGQVVFNPYRDVLFFGPREGFMAAIAQLFTAASLSSPDDLACIRRLALSDSLFWTHTSYNSTHAVSLTADALRCIFARLPGLEEIIFVPHTKVACHETDAMTTTRITGQVQTALRDLDKKGCGQRRDIKWNVLPSMDDLHMVL